MSEASCGDRSMLGVASPGAKACGFKKTPLYQLS
jgi:hypothetical protein